MPHDKRPCPGPSLLISPLAENAEEGLPSRLSPMMDGDGEFSALLADLQGRLRTLKKLRPFAKDSLPSARCKRQTQAHSHAAAWLLASIVTQGKAT